MNTLPTNIDPCAPRRDTRPVRPARMLGVILLTLAFATPALADDDDGPARTQVRGKGKSQQNKRKRGKKMRGEARFERTPDMTDEEARELAEILNQEGHRFARDLQYARALQRFKQAYELSPEPRFMLNQARMYRWIGRYRQAYGYYTWYMYLESGDTPRGRELLAVARKEQQEIAQCQVDPRFIEHEHIPSVVFTGRHDEGNTTEFYVRVTPRGYLPFQYTGWRSDTVDNQGLKAELTWYDDVKILKPGQPADGVLRIEHNWTQIANMDIKIEGYVGEMIISGQSNVLTTTFLTAKDAFAERRGKQTILSVRGMYGAALLSKPGQPTVSAASMGGVGVRVQKGLIPLFALEAEAEFAKAGTATMKDGSTRESTMARVTGMAVVRFGLVNEFSGRAGIGLQLTGMDSSDDSVSGWAVAPSLAMGMGYTRRWEKWSLGLDLSYVAPQGADAVQTLAVGARIGMGL